MPCALARHLCSAPRVLEQVAGHRGGSHLVASSPELWAWSPPRLRSQPTPHTLRTAFTHLRGGRECHVRSDLTINAGLARDSAGRKAQVPERPGIYFECHLSVPWAPGPELWV